MLLRNDAQRVEPAVPATVDLVMLAMPRPQVVALLLVQRRLVQARFLRPA